MKIYSNTHKSKYHLVFIHGLHKSYNDWNITSCKNAKHINIEETLKSKYNTHLVQIEASDYFRSIIDVANDIYDKLTISNVTIIAHSYGCFYAIQLGLLDHMRFRRLLLLDPTLPTPLYMNYLQELSEPLRRYQYDNFDRFPDITSLHNKVIVRIHKSLQEIDNDYFCLASTATKKNLESHIIVHYKMTHMIHYKIPHVVIKSIRDIAKL